MPILRKRFKIRISTMMPNCRATETQSSLLAQRISSSCLELGPFENDSNPLEAISQAVDDGGAEAADLGGGQGGYPGRAERAQLHRGQIVQGIG